VTETRPDLIETSADPVLLPVRGSGREPTVEETIEIVRLLHAGQVDFGGQPYIDHLLAVMGNLPPGSPDRRIKAALLHDSLEDVVLDRGTPQERRFTADDLRAWGYGEDVVRIVIGVTKKEHDPSRYAGLSREERAARVDADYLDAIRAMAAEGDLDVMEVKRADNLHNGDPSRDRFLTRPADLARSARLRARYEASAEILTQAIDALGCPRRL
jgi:(p)ppGpp synthase/HD superfamily hydrolase